MDIFFQDPDVVRLPPEQVRLLKLQVNPQPGGKRVKVHLELTPFKKRPNLELAIRNEPGKEVAHSSILETMLHKVEVTMHLRELVPEAEYELEAVVYYQALPPLEETEAEVLLPEPMVVDRQKVSFRLPAVET